MTTLPAIKARVRAGEIARLRSALEAALPWLVNDSPGGCTGEYTECDHCAVIRQVRAALTPEP